MTFSILIFTLLTLFSCVDNSADSIDKMKDDLVNLSGTYMDVEPYAYGDAYGQRIFTFDKGNWTLKFTLGLDPNLENQVFEFRTFGKYQVLQPSKFVNNAYQANFGEDKKFVTLKTENPQLLEAFGFSSCGLSLNIEKDISIEGCSLWKPVAVCPVDHDLLSLDDEGRLFFGVRPADNDMCSEDKRPKALTPGVTKN